MHIDVRRIRATDRSPRDIERLYRRAGTRHASRGCSIEPLESRLQLAAIAWDGGAGTDSWHDALNWSNDAVPTAADDVTIADTALAEVRLFADEVEVRSLSLEESLRVGGGRTLTLHGNASINGTLVIGDGASHNRVRFSAAASVLEGTGQIVLGSDGNGFEQRLDIINNALLTISPEMTIRGSGVVFVEQFASVENHGSIVSDSGGLSINLICSGLFTNQGLIRAQNGIIAVFGQLANGDALIQIDEAGLLILSGPISSGTIHGLPGARISNATLSGVTITGDIAIWDHSLAITNGLRLDGILRIGNGTFDSELLFYETAVQAITGSGEVVFPAADSGIVQQIRADNGLELTIGPGIIVRGGNGSIRTASASASIVNHGTIAADVAGQTLALEGAGSFMNSGSLSAANGATLTINSSITNTGNIAAIDGTVQFAAALTNASSGTVSALGGTVDLQSGSSAGTINAGVAGTVNFQAAFSHFVGALYLGSGTINFSGGVQTFNPSAFAFSSHVTVGAGAILQNAGTLTFSGSVTWSGRVAGAGTTTFASTAAVEYRGGGYGGVVHNHGIINWTDGDLELAGGATFTNHAGATFTFNVPASRPFGYIYVPSGLAAIINEGLFSKVGLSTLTVLSQPGRFDFTNRGTIAHQAGTWILPARFFINEAAGAVNVLSGTMVIFNASNQGSLSVAAGAAAGLTQTPEQIVDNALVGGTWIVAGTLSLPAQTSILSLGPGTTFTLDGPAASVGGALSGLAINNGTLTLANGAPFAFAPLDNAFTNNGTFIKSGAANTSIDAPLSFTNNGTVRVLGGTLQFINSLAQVVSNTLTGGTWIVESTLSLVGQTILTIGPAATISLEHPTAALIGSLPSIHTNNGTLTFTNGAPFPFSPAGNTFFNNGTLNFTGTGASTIPPAITINNGAPGIAGGTINIGSELRGPGGGGIFGPIDGGGVINIRGTATFDLDGTIPAIINLFPTGTLTGMGDIVVTGTFNWLGGTQSGSGSTTAAANLNLVSTGIMTLARALTNTFAGNWTGGCLLLDGGQFLNAVNAPFTITGSVEIESTGAGDESFTNDGDLIFAAGSESSFGTSVEVTNNPTGTIFIAAVISFEEDETLFGNIGLIEGGEITGPGDLTIADRFAWQGGSMTGTGRTIIAAAAILEMGNENMTLSRTMDNFSTAGNWTGGCLLMAGGIFNNAAGASLSISADPRIDVLGISGDNEFNNAGLITVLTGEFVIAVPGTNSGTIIVIPPDTLVFAATRFYLPGSSIEGPGGVAFFAGSHTIPTGGLSVTGPITIAGGTLVLPGLFLDNYDQETQTFTGGNWVIGDGGQLFLNGADIRTIGPGTTFSLSGNWMLEALDNLERTLGTLRLQNGATFNAAPLGGAPFRNDGALIIGADSLFSVSADYQQSAAAILEIGIAGHSAGMQGRITIAGLASLGGTLSLSYAEGLDVSLGDSFRFLTVGSVSGEFATTSIVGESQYLRVLIDQDQDGFRFTVVHAADWDRDFDVDVPDIFGFLAAWFADDGDFNNDGSNTVPDIFAFLAAWFSAA